jgi:hypothetical protein
MAIPIYLGFRSLFEYRHPKNIYKVVKDAFTRIIKKQKLSIAEINLFGNRLIAIDSKLKKLVLIQYKHGIVWENCLNLRKMAFCRIAKTTNMVSGETQKVNLELLTFGKGRTIIFPFFDEKVDVIHDLPARIKSAQYWKGKVQYEINTAQLTNAR